METYKYTQINNPVKLNREIKNSDIGSLINSLSVVGDSITIITNISLSSNEESILSGIISAHTIQDSEANTSAIIENAIEFAHSLLVNFASQNVMEGITQAGKTKDVIDYLNSVQTALSTGSLYVAIDEINALIAATVPVELSPYVTADKLITFRDKIQEFLNG